MTALQQMFVVKNKPNNQKTGDKTRMVRSKPATGLVKEMSSFLSTLMGHINKHNLIFGLCNCVAPNEKKHMRSFRRCLLPLD